jgi:hypothetical protein
VDRTRRSGRRNLCFVPRSNFNGQGEVLDGLGKVDSGVLVVWLCVDVSESECEDVESVQEQASSCSSGERSSLNVKGKEAKSPSVLCLQVLNSTIATIYMNVSQRILFVPCNGTTYHFRK